MRCGQHRRLSGGQPDLGFKVTARQHVIVGRNFCRFDSRIVRSERRQGKEKFRAFNARMTHNYKEELKDIVVLVSKDATRAAAEFNVHGVYKNTEEGLPDAVGQKYVLPAGTFFAIRDGKIARVTTYYNLTDWIAQVAG